MSKITGDTLGKLFESAAALYPQNEAIIQGKNRISYKQYLDAVNCIANALCRMGVKKGDKVAIFMPNRPEWAYIHFAAVKIGAPVVGINTRLKTKELKYILKQSDSTTLFLVDHFIGIDYVSMLYDILPELKTSKPKELVSKKIPLLKNVIVIGDRSYNGMLNFEDVLKAGKGYSVSELKKRLEEVNPEDVYSISFTSGTTGIPKGIVVPNGQFIRSMKAVGRRLGVTPQKRLLVVGPFTHGIGNRVGMSMAASHGACMIPMQQFDPGEALGLIESENVTTFCGSPTIYSMMLNHPEFSKHSPRSITEAIIGAADVQPELVKAIREKMQIRDVINSYGMAESGVATMTQPEDPIEVVANTAGRFVHDDCELKIFDPNSGEEVPQGEQGEIRIKGWFVLKEYYKMPDETEKAFDKNGWFHTGDLGVIDDSGNLRITGRHKDMLITGGLNVYPAEVENFLITHPKIADVAVVEVPDERLGEVPMAFVQLKAGKLLSREELLKFAKDTMANYKVPKYVQFVEHFPVTSSGKIKKDDLRKKARKTLGIEQ